MNYIREESINRDIVRYGQGILRSKEFRAAQAQTHHRHTTVAEHTLSVSRTSLRISYYLRKAHIRVNTRDLVVASLCHDLGILGREEKYDSMRECYRQHPEESVEVARRLVPDINERTEKMIARHMWPVTPKPPVSREGYILTAADKYCAAREGLQGINRRVFGWLRVKPVAEAEQ